MIRWATVTDVTAEGVWVVSAWLPGRTGPIPVTGSPSEGDPVLVLRTDDGELAAIRGGDTRYLPLTGGTVTGPLTVGGLTVRDTGAGFIEMLALVRNIRLQAGTTKTTLVYNGGITVDRATVTADSASTLTTKGYVDAIKSDVKAIAAASTSFADFQTRMAAW